MIQATGSNAGKSLFVAGLARLLHRRGLRVAPFKPQNMANNAAVALDGGEIARAQALQCLACACETSSDMNPVLLKPQNDGSSQLIVQGCAVGSVRASDYPRMRARLLGKVRESYHRLAQKFEVIIVEGAGSPAEVNLRAGDIANMGFATAEQVPVLILADIERGGSIAALCGTHQLLEQQERALVRGFLINKFRGEVSLFKPAIEVIAQRTGWRSAGVVTWCEPLGELPAEDSLDLRRGGKIAKMQNPGLQDSGLQNPDLQNSGSQDSGLQNISLENLDKTNSSSPSTPSSSSSPKLPCRVTALRCPYMANADDLDPLLLDENFEVRLLEAGSPIPSDSDVVLLLGSKSVLADLAFLRAQGWDIDIVAHRRRGGIVFGICGGYQMLGLSIEDDQGLEGWRGKKAGLALLDLTTEITQGKKLSRIEGLACLPSVAPLAGVSVVGYEMHNGETRLKSSGRRGLDRRGIEKRGIDKNRVARSLHSPAAVRPWLSLGLPLGVSIGSSPQTARDSSRDELDINFGALSADGCVLGCYLHGIFASGEFRRAFYQYACSSPDRRAYTNAGRVDAGKANAGKASAGKASAGKASAGNASAGNASAGRGGKGEGVGRADGWRGGFDYAERIEEVLDIWADHLAGCCDIEFIVSLLSDVSSDGLSAHLGDQQGEHPSCEGRKDRV